MNFKKVIESVGSGALAVAAAVTVGKWVDSRASSLGDELSKARKRRELEIQALRRCFDEAQNVSDRLSASALSVLPQRLNQELPFPTPAEMRACSDRSAKIALWQSLGERVFARALILCCVQSLVGLTSRIQMAAISGQYHFSVPFQDPLVQMTESEINEIQKIKSRAESLKIAFVERFVRLRENEYLLFGSGFSLLAELALKAAHDAFGNWELTKQMKFSDIVRILLMTRSQLSNDIKSKLTDILIGPEKRQQQQQQQQQEDQEQQSGSNYDDNMTELLLFYTRKAIANENFWNALEGCINMRLVSINQRARTLFPDSAIQSQQQNSANNNNEQQKTNISLLPPKILPQLSIVFEEEATPACYAAALQEIGTSQLVDRFMFSIFVGSSSN